MRTVRMRSKVALFGSLVALLLLAQPSSAASADDAPSSDDGNSLALSTTTPSDVLPQFSVAEFADRNDRLAAFYTQILRDPGTAQAGFVDMVANVASLSAQVYWNGNVDEGNRNLLDEASNNTGVSYKIAPWPYSRSTLNSAVDEITANLGWTFDGVQLTSIGTFGADDFEGLEVRWYPLSDDSPEPNLDIVRRDIRASEPDVPFQLIEAGPQTYYDTNRDDDYSPFNAGGLMHGATSGENCTSGFGIHLSNGLNYVTTADHCVSTDFAAYSVPTNVYGTHTGTQPSNGLGRMLSGSSSHLMFSSTYTSTGRRSVLDDYDFPPHSYVYTSGGNTGSHASIYIDSTGNTITDPLLVTVSDAVFAHQASNSVASGPGDSGGPVFGLHEDGDVYAVGMIQSGDNRPVEEGGHRVSCSAEIAVYCSSDVVYTPFYDIYHSIGGTLTTSLNS